MKTALKTAYNASRATLDKHINSMGSNKPFSQGKHDAMPKEELSGGKGEY